MLFASRLGPGVTGKHTPLVNARAPSPIAYGTVAESAFSRTPSAECRALDWLANGSPEEATI